jgi:hypothetical protein
MAELELTQAEADLFINIEKHCIENKPYLFPSLGGSLAIPLHSFDRRENFFLDISRSRINLSKGKYQSRVRQAIVLLRLDFGGAPHRNPDDEEIICPHLHTYREGYGDKWAIPIPIEKFPNIDDAWQTLQDFMKYCNITQLPNIRKDLFV